MTLFSRRSLMHASSAGLIGALAAKMTERDAFAEGVRPLKSVVVLWMNGGPSHIDTWDPKPGTAVGGPHKAIKTRVPGLSISEHLPHMAEIADKLAVVRSLSTKEGNHQRAQYLLHTGYVPNPTVQHPSFGGWVAKKTGQPESGLPAFVSIGGPSRNAGFLGVQHGPFVLAKGGSIPNDTEYGRDVDTDRFDRRRRILDGFESSFFEATGDGKVEGRRALYDKAVRLMRAPDLKSFDLADVSDSIKSSFGNSDFGRGCLVASRLVEKGVKVVEVVLDGWDTHQDNFTRVKNLMGVLDPAMSGLVRELERKRLLESTLVVWMGDFGRTPKINANEGRDHFPGCSAAVLVGGGVRRGVIYGATDADGAKVAKDPVSVPDFFATLAALVGLDPHEEMISPIGRPIAVTDSGTPIRTLIG